MQNEFSRVVEAMCAPSTVETPTRETSADERAALVKEGQDLAWRVMNQHWRIALAPHNKQECAAADDLQKLFAVWETRAVAAGLRPEEVGAGYDLKPLRPYVPNPQQEPARKPDWSWGFVVRDNTPPAPKLIKERRPYGACSAPGLE